MEPEVRMDALAHTAPKGGGESHADRARRMAALVHNQRELCVQLDSLSRAQSELVEGGDTDGVLEVLGKRQQIIDRMSRLNEDLAPLREQRETLMSMLGSGEREYVRACIDEINDLVECVRGRDEQDRQVMERRRAGIASEISGMTRARGAVAAYSGVRAPGGPKFQDRQG